MRAAANLTLLVLALSSCSGSGSDKVADEPTAGERATCRQAEVWVNTPEGETETGGSTVLEAQIKLRDVAAVSGNALLKDLSQRLLSEDGDEAAAAATGLAKECIRLGLKAPVVPTPAKALATR
jgi:hypothetical protein